MVTKCLKITVLVVVIVLIVGVLLFGTNLKSYIWSSAKHIRSSVSDSVPIEFELLRARDLLEEIIPEMHANIRMISEDEVEVAALKADIEQSEKPLAAERNRVAKMHKQLNTHLTSYNIGSVKYNRAEFKEELAQRFDRFREAVLVQASKKRLLIAREKSLKSALDLLDQTRARKRLLENKIEGLESQYRLVQAASVGSPINIDNSKLTKTERLISQIKKRLDVAERVLAHESRFTVLNTNDSIDEKELLSQLDEYFTPEKSDEQLNALNQVTQDQKLCQAAVK